MRSAGRAREVRAGGAGAEAVWAGCYGWPVDGASGSDWTVIVLLLAQRASSWKSWEQLLSDHFCMEMEAVPVRKYEASVDRTSTLVWTDFY